MGNNRYYKKKPIKEDNYIPPYDVAILSEPVTNLKFRGENTQKLLEGAGIVTLSDVLKREEKDFYRILTFNKKNLLDVKGALKVRNLLLKPTPEPIKTESENAEQKVGENPEQPGTIVNAPKQFNNINRQNPNQRLNPQNNNQSSINRQNVNGQRQNIQQNGAPNQQRQQQNNQRPQQQNNQRQQQQNNQKQNQQNNQEQRPQPPKKQTVVIPTDIYVKVNKSGKWGFTDRTNKVVVEPIYDEVFNYKEDICCVEQNELFGYINRSGEEIIPIMYECGSSFSEGLACVYKGGKCGYINPQNEVIIDFKYDAGTAFEEGSCRIKKDGKWGELNLTDINTIRWIN